AVHPFGPSGRAERKSDDARGVLRRVCVVGVYSAAVTLLLAAGLATASHAQDLTDDEAKCQVGTSLAIGKFVTEKAKCLIKCEQGARKALNPPSDCVPPYAGDTLTCVPKAGSV